MTIFYFILLFSIALVVLLLIWQGIMSLFHDSKTLFHYATGYRIKHWWHRRILPNRIKPSYRVILEEQNHYYRNLSPENRLLFEKRVQQFISMKEFISRSERLRITDEMKTLIAAAAVQLTFGLPGIYFLHFHRILIYPDDYYSVITKMYHQGEVNRAGIIVLSWRNFVRGIGVADDGRNLGLHEMAHALLLEDMIINGEYEFLNRDHLARWNHAANQEIEKIRNGNQTIFREYGATNRHEFFAVAVEMYFEQPVAFRSYNQNLFNTMNELLNQNILALTSVR